MELPKRKGYHRHHIIPKYMGGDDSEDNLVYLTPEEHALAHLELYEKYGNYEDAQAFNTLSSQWLDGRTVSGYKQSDDHIRKRIEATDYGKISRKLKEKYKNEPHPSAGKKLGSPSKETRKKISEANKGKKKNNEKGLMGGARKKYSYGNYTCMCMYCRKPVSPSKINRHSKCIDLVKGE